MAFNFSSRILGPLLVALASALWATDAIFRFTTVRTVSPIVLVFFEHLVALVVLMPIAFFRRRQFTELAVLDWTRLIFLGSGASAIALLLFTYSFQSVNPSVAILLQKLQPVFATLLAVSFLGERPSQPFFIFAPLAIVSGVLLSFPDMDFSFLRGTLPPEDSRRLYGIYAALGAAAIWASAIIVGKSLTARVSPLVTTFWRYWFGWLTLLALLVFGEEEIPWDALTDVSTVQAIAYVALVPGLLAMLLYYYGISKTRATIATFVELIFPFSAVLLNAYYLHSPLEGVQLVAGGLLLMSITMISLRGLNR